jgi:RNA polymerase sigma-70 factor (ECF subfamily)
MGTTSPGTVYNKQINLSGEGYLSETNLVIQAQAGADPAWEALLTQHQEAVFRLAYLLLGNADEAQDVAQEVFIRAFRFLHQFDQSRPLRPWLLRITTNLAYNHRRAVGRYWAAVQRLFWAAPQPTAAASTEETPPADDAQALWRAVQRLSRPDQEIIYLRYFLELSVAETAEAAGIASGTVKSRLNRALKRLRQVVEQEFPGLWKEHTV